MLNFAELLEKEHEIIEDFLVELETIIHSQQLNYSNLHNFLNNFSKFWDEHEEKEEKIFQILEKEGFKIPTKKITFEHNGLRKYRDEISKAISSGSELKVKNCLNTLGKEMIMKFRKHLKEEDWIIYAVSEEMLSEKAIEKLESVS